MNTVKLSFLFVSLLCSSSVFAIEYGLNFDDDGNIIQPDREYLWRGLKAEKEGYRKDALRNFMKSAEYGNYHAMSSVALYLMQDKDFKAAHAWFKLIDLNKIPNRGYLEDIISKLEVVMTAEELRGSKELKAELSEIYGLYPTLFKRDKWRKSMKFSGTRIKGYVPPFLKVGLISPGASNLFLLPKQISSDKIRRQIYEFIYEYEFGVDNGEVILKEIEILEDN